MRKLLLKCLEYVFPPHEEVLRVRSITHEKIRLLYTIAEADGIRALSPYTHPDIRALIHEAKFRRNGEAFQLLHELVVKYFAQYTKDVDMIIPIPLSRARMRARGYNQVTEMLKVDGVKITIPLVTDVLTRVRDTRPQTALKRTERLANLHDAFGVVHGERITGKHILLIDDVTTTGTTLKTAKAALLPYKPASVTMVALAH